jgi:hypothetical protein
VSIIDGHAVDDPVAEVNRLTDGETLVGLSVMTPQLESAIEISRWLRSNRKGAPIVWGGIHPSLEPVQVLQSGLVDFAVLGLEEKCCGDQARRLGNEYIFQTLAAENIETRCYFDPPVHRQQAYQPYAADEALPVTDRLAAQALVLPMYWALTVDDVDRVCEAIARIHRHCRGDPLGRP